jgi:hypothetical protein
MIKILRTADSPTVAEISNKHTISEQDLWRERQCV